MPGRGYAILAGLATLGLITITVIHGMGMDTITRLHYILASPASMGPGSMEGSTGASGASPT